MRRTIKREEDGGSQVQPPTYSWPSGQVMDVSTYTIGCIRQRNTRFWPKVVTNRMELANANVRFRPEADLGKK